MATRRLVGGEKTFLDKDDTPEKSDISPAVPSYVPLLKPHPSLSQTPHKTNKTHPRHVIYKLLGFSFAMIVIPIGSYFLTVNTVFNGKNA